MTSIAIPPRISVSRTAATPPPLLRYLCESQKSSVFLNAGFRRKNPSKVSIFCNFDGNNVNKFRKKLPSLDISFVDKEKQRQDPESPTNNHYQYEKESFAAINSYGFPISLRIIKMKRRLVSEWPETVPVYLVSSIIKSLSSVLLMIDDLLNLIFNEASSETSITISRELSDSLVLLFKNVFFRSPILFLLVLNLLADLIVFSVRNSVGISIFDGLSQNLFEFEKDGTWEDDNCFDRRRITYERLIFDDPENSLILSNYAQFLYRIAKDNDRAEEFFKRAVRGVDPDGEALSQYAMFLWHKRGDMDAAEAAFLAAIDVDPRNCYHRSNYAWFLWKTGAAETCHPSYPSL